MRIKRIVGRVVTLSGCVVILLAIGAEYLGIDRHGGWGPSRKFMLIAGIFLFSLPHLRKVAIWILGVLTITNDPEANDDKQVNYSNKDLDEAHREERSRQHAHGKRPVQNVFGIRFILSVVFISSTVIYIWVGTFGRWNEWPETTNYYHLLADGFRLGETHLLLEPPQELLDLSNPYDHSQREGITYLWDVSLFQGKYYLYWGPWPAIFIIPFESLLNQPINDQQISTFFSILLAVGMLLILEFIWNEIVPDAPTWILIPFALTATLANPLLWVLTRPAIYEASILAGQAFFILGLYSLLPIFSRKSIPAWRLIVAGIAWSGAVGSRLTLAPVIIFLSILVTILIIRSTSAPSKRIRAVLTLLIPLILGAGSLALYNFSRFGSFLEFGVQYQLGQLGIFGEPSEIAAWKNFPINLNNYLLTLPKWISSFPYFKPGWGQYAIPILHYEAPSSYYSEKVTGMLITFPHIFIGLYPIIRWLNEVWTNLDVNHWKRLSQRNPFRHPTIGIMYSSLFFGIIYLFIPLLSVRFISMRYQLDIIPTICIWTVLGYGYQVITGENGVASKWMNILVTILALWTVAISLLLMITGPSGRMEALNPELFEALTSMFSW